MVARSLARFFGYDATDDRGRRRSPRTVTKSEDRHADERKRRILSATSRDLARNFAIASWAIRKHLDYVSAMRFQAKTPDKGYNAYFEQRIKEVSTKLRVDSRQRHGLRKFRRLAEACRAKDGDVIWIKLAPPPGNPNRGRCQAIEADRICLPRGSQGLPDNFNRDDWVNGLKIGSQGQIQAFAICDRPKSQSSQLEFRRAVPARNVLMHGFYDRYDQYRGVSPIAASLNWFQDTYEGFEYALARLKVAQLFGFAITRDGEGPAFDNTDATTDSDGDGVNDSDYEIDLKGGPNFFDLDPGDDVKLIESATPATETVDYLKLMIHVALKSLDIPYSFFDESFTNFYGSRGGLMQYLKSCKDKTADLQEFSDEWTQWRAGLMVADGTLELPRGKDFSFLEWEWVPDGVPWWDPVKEVNGALASIQAGLTSPQRVCRETGTDYETNIREISEALQCAEDMGVKVSFDQRLDSEPSNETEVSESDEGEGRQTESRA